ncbi:MAG TPA: formate/nitrite transporter family protein [Methylomirabilota bacterium]|nr:formate/nitrite transporter family protein [Methylomirabilota bacterium]
MRSYQSPFLATLDKSAADYASLTWTNFFLVNLLPVTLGNVIGSVALVGLMYWFIYLRPEVRNDTPPASASGSRG